MPEPQTFKEVQEQLERKSFYLTVNLNMGHIYDILMFDPDGLDKCISAIKGYITKWETSWPNEPVPEAWVKGLEEMEKIKGGG